MIMKDKKSAVEKAAEFIVDKRKGFYLIYIVLVIFAVVTAGWVKVNNDLTDYLDKNTETRRGIDIMESEFTTYATADIMVDNISYSAAEKLCERLEELDGVKEIGFDETDKHYFDGAALFSVTFAGDSDDAICEEALNNIKNELKEYDIYVSAELGNTKAETIAKEVSLVMVIVAVIVISVLLLASKTYMEVPVLLLTFLVAAVLNKGSNYFLGTISFVSDSVAIVLQLALAIDYAIILCHRYTEEREKKPPKEAVVTALCKAIPEISGSCLTTVSGLTAMTFMHFKIGYDMGIVLIKAIAISILVVFTLMPGLILSFSPLIDKTHHKSFIPEISIWGRIVLKLRYIAPGIFGVIVVIGIILSNMCPYAYSCTELTTIKKNESQIARSMINKTFRITNTLAVLVPSGNFKKEQELISRLSEYDEIDTVSGLASAEAMDGYLVGDMLKPRRFAELTDMDIEEAELLYAAYAANDENYGRIVGGINNFEVPLIDIFEFLNSQADEGYINLSEKEKKDLEDIDEKLKDAKKQLLGENYSRIVLDLNLPEESEETFEFLGTVKNEAKKIFGENVVLVGNSTSDYDISKTFVQDNLLISILSVIFVMLVLLFTFQSAGIPIILILVIQGSIWINFSFPTMLISPMFFLSYLVVSAIQMGANIDYAIVITNRYVGLRSEMPHKEAVITAINQSFPTIFTSGTILASAGFTTGLLSSEPSISSLGISLGRGTVISIILVMGILPQLLIIGDTIIEKTSFKVKLPIKNHTSKGSVLVNGQIHGYINGRIDGSFTGRVNGEMDANILNGEAVKEDNHE